MEKYVDLTLDANSRVKPWAMGFLEDTYTMAYLDRTKPLEILVFGKYRIEAKDYNSNKEKYDAYIAKQNKEAE